MNIALILAGGTGSRLGEEIPKQYIEVNEQPIIAWCVEVLTSNSNIDCMYIVADEKWRDYIMENVNTRKLVGFVEPGATRQLSIWNGMLEIDKNIQDSCRTILIHDAARPFLTNQLLDDIYVAMKGHDGVMPVLSMKDTVYYSEDGRCVDRLLDRNRIYAGQAPECFDFDKYYYANKQLLPDKIMSINGSTQPAMLADMDVVMIPGDENNFKITTKSDLQRFREMRQI